MDNPKELLGKTVQYTTSTPKCGTRVVKGVVTDVSEVGGEKPWFKIMEDLGSGRTVSVAVWYALEWIPDWKVLD